MSDARMSLGSTFFRIKNCTHTNISRIFRTCVSFRYVLAIVTAAISIYFQFSFNQWSFRLQLATVFSIFVRCLNCCWPVIDDGVKVTKPIALFYFTTWVTFSIFRGISRITVHNHFPFSPANLRLIRGI